MVVLPRELVLLSVVVEVLLLLLLLLRLLLVMLQRLPVVAQGECMEQRRRGRPVSSWALAQSGLTM